VKIGDGIDMADDVVIRTDGLGKKYVIGHMAERERYVALRDVLARGARSAWRTTLDLARGRAILAGDTVEEFWALRDVSFEVRRGEVLGIIGRNGAGKTTLLKILSRITEPSEGRVTIRGRVASLLEVGTGFHPELTGRENIYLNGAILGMTRAEIRRKFDEIVAFAEVEKFLDTPVKRYSSGMYVRLAFAVAAHLEPEILIVDEVLAVGDAEFQKRCLGKMSEVASGGRTVLFVSHNMASVRSLCQSAILLESGRVAQVGPVEQTIQSYGIPAAGIAEVRFQTRPDKPSISQVSLDKEALRAGHFSVRIEFTSPYPLRNPTGGILVSSITGLPVWGSNGRFDPNGDDRISACSGILTCECTDLPLAPSTYTISVWLCDWHQDFDERRDILSFEFRKESESRLRPNPNLIGHVDWPASWKFRKMVAGSDANSSGRQIVGEHARSYLGQHPLD
jgi:lipopolysaccharide transport system ATP-binding protein